MSNSEAAEQGSGAHDASSERVDWRNVPSRPCPVAESLELFGDRWSILIIRDVMNGVRRFDDLVDRLGISRATLSDRLRRLVTAGILVTAEYDSGRGRTRTEYRLSESGRELRNVLIALREWGDRHVLGEGNEPLRLVDRMSGHGVHLRLVDDETGEVVEPRRLAHVPGPAFRPDSDRSHHPADTTPGATE
jgi:DNA-binding HxlR family transcriptional regulator